MRAAWIMMLSAALVLGTWVGVGHAFDLPEGQNLIMNLTDASCLFNAFGCPAPGTRLTPQFAAFGSDPLTNPLVGAPGLVTGDESRTVFNITAITGASGGGVFFAQSATEEISGLVYDLRLATTTYTAKSIDTTAGIQTGEGEYELWFTGAKRNPILGAPALTGGVIEFYNDTAGTNGLTSVDRSNPSLGGPGPEAWLASTGPGHGVGAIPSGLPGGADGWAAGQATDDSLWIAGVLTAITCIDGTGAEVACTLVGDVPNPAAIPIVLKETIRFSPTNPNFNVVSTAGVAYIDVLGGSQQGAIVPAAFGTGPGGTQRDLEFSFSSNPLFGNSAYALGPASGTDCDPTTALEACNTWQLDSSDPIRVKTIPQPGSHILLGLGLLIAFFALRRWGGIVPTRPAV